MPALNHPRPHTETLANGLRVTLRHAPDLKRCAGALRVAAGSHDVPLAWPGLAHFLEHLMFLGTERFPAEQGLMAYVRGLLAEAGVEAVLDWLRAQTLPLGLAHAQAQAPAAG